MTNLKPGNLIKTKHNPMVFTCPTGKEPPVNYFFCNKRQHNYPIPVGTIGLIISTTRKSSVDNLIVDILFEDQILSIAQYDDYAGNPYWCEIIS